MAKADGRHWRGGVFTCVHSTVAQHLAHPSSECIRGERPGDEGDDDVREQQADRGGMFARQTQRIAGTTRLEHRVAEVAQHRRHRAPLLHDVVHGGQPQTASAGARLRRVREVRGRHRSGTRPASAATASGRRSRTATAARWHDSVRASHRRAAVPRAQPSRDAQEARLGKAAAAGAVPFESRCAATAAGGPLRADAPEGTARGLTRGRARAASAPALTVRRAAIARAPRTDASASCGAPSDHGRPRFRRRPPLHAPGSRHGLCRPRCSTAVSRRG